MLFQPYTFDKKNEKKSKQKCRFLGLSILRLKLGHKESLTLTEIVHQRLSK